MGSVTKIWPSFMIYRCNSLTWILFLCFYYFQKNADHKTDALFSIWYENSEGITNLVRLLSFLMALQVSCAFEMHAIGNMLNFRTIGSVLPSTSLVFI